MNRIDLVVIDKVWGCSIFKRKAFQKERLGTPLGCPQPLKILILERTRYKFTRKAI